MASNKAMIHFLVLPALIIFAIIAGISLSQIRYLSLPIPESTPIAALILPIITGIGIRGAQSILTQSDDSLLKRRSLPSWVLPAGFMFLVVYETVLATLAVTQMIPSDVLSCGLSEHWQSLWSSHNAEAIKRIQDAHNCCGLNTVKDRAWPFGGNKGAGTCSITYGRGQSCLPGWKRDQQINAGLILLVAVGTFLVKGGVLVLYRGRGPLMQHIRRGYAALTAGESDVEGGTEAQESRHGQGRIEAPYRDEAESDVGIEEVDGERDQRVRAQGDSRDQHGNMILQPSSIRDEDNEWRA